jgi:hypothetical protein
MTPKVPEPRRAAERMYPGARSESADVTHLPERQPPAERMTVLTGAS